MWSASRLAIGRRSPLLRHTGGSQRRRPRWPRASDRPIWTDRWAAGLALAGLALIGALSLTLRQRFEALPELIAIHFNAYGEVDLIGSKSEIYKLPLIGTLIWAANGAIATVASPNDRVLARVALGAALLVEALFCAAVWRILS
jgi:hypothetical protein